MSDKAENSIDQDKTLAAVCGLFCEACTAYIATKDDPGRLKELAERFQIPEEVMKCLGCRSEKRGPYCQQCKMCVCAADRGHDFCVECEEYPCSDLKQFQSEAPHRIELWEDLARIKTVGYKVWVQEAREKYTCPGCGGINSAYDLKCRVCGREPSCAYVAKHKQEILQFLEKYRQG